MRARRNAEDPLLRKILEAAPEGGVDAHDRILEAAIAEAEEFGMRRFTIGDVARRAGLSRVTIYNHCPGKDRLVEAVLLHELRRFLRDIDAAVADCETLEDRLVEGFVFGLTYLRRHRLLNRLLRSEPELLLPYLTVKANPVLAAGRAFIAGFARQDDLPLNEEQIQGVSELLARAVLSFVLTPESVLGLKTQAEIRGFAETYLAPTLQAIAALPPAREVA
jgi:AcrR family transcriptional regulator